MTTPDYRPAEIHAPYLLFLGDIEDSVSAKMARAVVTWRPDKAVGQLRMTGSTVSVGIEDLSIAEAVARGARTLVIGVANSGGKLPGHWRDVIVEAIRHGMDVASGMHQRLTAIEGVNELARDKGVTLHDIRHSHPPLEVGNGERRQGTRVLTVGTDCSLGKMFSSLAIQRGLEEAGVRARFRATGQCGVLVAGEGVAIDAVIADFIAGAVEWLSPAGDDDQWDIIEGQGSLFHPAYAGVSLGLLHGAQPDWLVMCHELGRPHMRHLPGRPMPEMSACIEANLWAARVTNPDVRLAGFSVNTSNVDEETARRELKTLEERFGVPATDPIRFGIAPIVHALTGGRT
ncbi:N-acetyltransferase DgcN [Kushneria aurantia]|uniref:N-acetyltransferase DgcN n=1 Tax=Kushneria aurantia TaxID=504092 RepID=A0ABV6G7W0_9GAMM|nr:N-acetyltransferase DgcN [Kushneria aurantia]